ncbi:hypothetical protein J40TS1_44510 [Paenibacillus montaniterrae]|uniref:Asparaginase n=1 Tax=Paenibacillus montaniterrae TaxID=429341 RepID=A0A919YUQ8_9BACL|nr:asparaginase [Paenibacillus montaniterrae]GIP18809.1 hypothetical protein J40TS1_44510 [Paenibacillus montaniterrae]
MESIGKKSWVKKAVVPAVLAAALVVSMNFSAISSYVKAATSPASTNFEIPAVSAEHQANENPNVIVIGTGGTLAGAATNGDKTSFQSYRAGTYPIQDLVDQLPGKEKIADVSTYQFGNKGSGGYTIADLYDLSLAVDQALEMYDGAVVTTGTDTMEEIAYFLDLTVQSEKPVVVTGAMRPWDVIGTDGPANLYQAIKTAASGKTEWFGTVIMLNDVIFAARDVTKSNTHRMDTFDSPMLGALGYVDDAGVRIYRAPARAVHAGTDKWSSPFDLTQISKEDLPAVEIVYNYQEAGGGAITGSVAEGAKGIVTAGTGAGGISSKLSAARATAISEHEVVFVSTSRTGSGSVYSSGNGIVSGDNLDPQHARMMLLLSLAFTNELPYADKVTKVREWFTTFGTQEVEISVDAETTVLVTPEAEAVETAPEAEGSQQTEAEESEQPAVEEEQAEAPAAP